MNTNKGALPSPSDEIINKMNKGYRITLPDDYISFIKEHNGEIPEKRVFYAN